MNDFPHPVRRFTKTSILVDLQKLDLMQPSVRFGFNYLIPNLSDINTTLNIFKSLILSWVIFSITSTNEPKVGKRPLIGSYLRTEVSARFSRRSWESPRTRDEALRTSVWEANSVQANNV